MKHIRGPWTFGGGSIWAKTSAGEMRIADVRGWGHLTGSGGLRLPDDKAEEIQDANGRMLAASERLYVVACRCAEYIRSNNDEQTCLYADLMDAIAKAEGK